MTKRIAMAPSILMFTLILAEAELISGPLRSRPIQAAVALPLALYLPGAVLRRALTRQAGDGLADQIVTSFGLSLAALAVGGVAVNLFAVGLRPMSWLAYLAVVMLSAELVAWVRNRGTAVLAPIRIPRVRPRQLAAGVAIMALVAVAFTVAIVGAHRQRFPGFAQFWLIPQSGQNYELGVVSYTGHVDSFAVNLEVGRRAVRVWHIRLSSGGSWSASVRLPAHASARATLFRNGTRGAYRQVFIGHTSA